MFLLLIMSLWMLRVWLVFCPQTGYIHPDEFFQSVEIAASDILDVQGERTWEFNASSPIRSAVIIHITCGIPLYILKALNQWLSTIFPGSMITAYSVLISPRLFITILSFINDFCIWNLSQRFGICTRTTLLLFASSYVSIVYLTRTLSNTTETLLFSSVLLISTSNLITPVQGRNFAKKDTYKGDNSDENLANLWHQTVMNSTCLGMLIACGVFNRPTFLMFVFVPVVVWLLNSYSMFNFAAKALHLSIGFCLMSALIISLDTTYYKTNMEDMHLDVVHCLEKSDSLTGCLYETSREHVVFTPWNFIMYNTNTENLSSHGMHPWYLHLTANSMILFGPLGILALYSIVKCCWSCISGQILQKSKQLPILLLMFYFPILALSLFPHQEPRFIIPLLTPAVLITAPIFLKRSNFGKFLTVVWILFNVIGVALFGFLHQGGVVPCLTDLPDRLSIHTSTDRISDARESQRPFGETHIIFSRTYMPPEHLLLQEKSSSLQGQSKGRGHVALHDLKGSDDLMLTEYTAGLKNRSSSTGKQHIYLVTPVTRVLDICHKLKMQWVMSYGPHLSMEDPPTYHDIQTTERWTSISECLPPGDTSSLWYRMSNLFSLALLKIL